MRSVREIELTQGYKAIIDDADYEMISAFRWHVVDIRGKLYAARSIKHGKQYMHRLIAEGTGEIDHRNGDGLDNRRANLRSATDSQQQANRPKQEGNQDRKFTSRFKGVSKSSHANTWQATLRFQGKSIYLGCFPTEEAAALAYNEAAAKYFGEFSQLNEVSND